MIKIVSVYIFLFLFLYTAPGQEIQTVNTIKGIAPFAVFFDAADPSFTTYPHESRSEFLDYTYYKFVWNYGDSDSEFWPYTGKSKNIDMGFTACHVYENPGTYQASLTITDTCGKKYIYFQNILVQDPDEVFADSNTICISSSGNFTDAPAGALLLTTEDITILKKYIAPGKRILLRRGDLWNSNKILDLYHIPGPVVIGAFGKGEDPNESGIYTNNPVIKIYGKEIEENFINYGDVSNWQIYDLHFIGDTGYYGCIGGRSMDINQMVLFRLHIEGFACPVETSSLLTKDHNRWMIINCNIHNAVSNLIYTGSKNLVIMGNKLNNSFSSHLIEVWQADNGIISHNLLYSSGIYAPAGQSILKIYSPGEETINNNYPSHITKRTNRITIYDNIFGNCRSNQVSIAPRDDTQKELISDILVESNTFFSNCNNNFQENKFFPALYLNSANTIIRNNLFDTAGSSNNYVAIIIDSTENVIPSGNLIYNNSYYNSNSLAFYGLSNPNYLYSCSLQQIRSFPFLIHFMYMNHRRYNFSLIALKEVDSLYTSFLYKNSFIESASSGTSF